MRNASLNDLNLRFWDVMKLSIELENMVVKQVGMR